MRDFRELNQQVNEVKRMLNSFIQKLTAQLEIVSGLTSRHNRIIPRKVITCDFLLDLYQSHAHQGLAKSLDIFIGMPTLFANLAASKFWHISSQKTAQLS